MPLHNWAEFKGRDVIWFIDNEAACSAMIRGSSTSEDVQDITEAGWGAESLISMLTYGESLVGRSLACRSSACSRLVSRWWVARWRVAHQHAHGW